MSSTVASAVASDSKKLREIFNKYASVEKGNEKFMKSTDLIRSYLLMLSHDNFNEETVDILANAVSFSDNGLISFAEFQNFETVLNLPDSLYHLAFQMFDVSSNGKIEFEEVRNIFGKTSIHQEIPFNWDCDFVRFHFGKKLNNTLSYHEFTQFLEELQYEHTTQAFHAMDKKGEGTIPLVAFKQIMQTIRPHMLTEFVQEKLISVMTEGGQSNVSFAYFKAFNHLLKNMELVKKIFSSVNKQACSKDEFMLGAQRVCHMTPLEVDLLFRMADLNGGQGRIDMDIIDCITPLEEGTMPYHIADQQKGDTADRAKSLAFVENAYRFSLGVVAGGVGATAVYPIDLVKTRLQNQRSSGSYVGELMYRNSKDCFTKVVRHEGVRGLYRGLIPQLVGVGPEKAIKLTMNDFVRDQLRRDGKVPLLGEIIAGATAGGCQVVFTNPLEIVKIRLQIAGEIATQKRVGAATVIKELGFIGLYKGARACLLRDIPFSAIYFPAYAHAKQFLAGQDEHVSPLRILLAATMAGVPAASLTTPADVIKTRLQVKGQEGQTVYKGVIDCARKVFAEEGFSAFWKGAPARVMRSSPQFGITLLTYELLQRFFNFDFGGSKPIGSQHKPKTVHISDLPPVSPDHIGGYRLGAATFAGIERRFGLQLPKFAGPTTPYQPPSNTCPPSIIPTAVANVAAAAAATRAASIAPVVD